MDLFDECLEALGKNKEILSEELTAKYYELLSNSFPLHLGTNQVGRSLLSSIYRLRGRDLRLAS